MSKSSRQFLSERERESNIKYDQTNYDLDKDYEYEQFLKRKLKHFKRQNDGTNDHKKRD